MAELADVYEKLNTLTIETTAIKGVVERTAIDVERLTKKVENSYVTKEMCSQTHRALSDTLKRNGEGARKLTYWALGILGSILFALLGLLAARVL